VNRVDREALQRALKLVRSEPAYREQIAEKLKAESWEQVAEFAAYNLQIDNLGLKPWMDPPCVAELRPDPDALAILVKLLGHGLSRLEPDPMAALAAVRGISPAATLGKGIHP
jgi:hypothetical protein